MNPAMTKSLTVGEVRSWLLRLLACGLLVVSLAGWTADEHTLPDLTVHEWGTFTAIAGKDGRAAEWCRQVCHDIHRPPIHPNSWSISTVIPVEWPMGSYPDALLLTWRAEFIPFK